MLVSIDWVKDFVKLPEDIDSHKLMTKFTMTTAEVEEINVLGLFWKKIKVAEIIDIQKHPEADKLNLVTFKFGENKTARVVCGASNVRVGLKTAYAPIGTTLPVGFTLEPKKIRGILSEGMLCSKEELGLEKSSEGIIEYDVEAIVGMTLKDYYQEKEDIILDIDNKSLTHRPDLWGHYGMAREFAALYKTNLLNPYDTNWQNSLEAQFTSEKSPIKVALELSEENAGLCYWGISIDNVKVKESPKWIKDRLISMGLKPINNIVDISNYVMFELGSPLHIFDRDKIKGDEVLITSLNEDTEFVTLDDNTRNLIKGDTVISDQNGPLVIAGIMGGLESGVSETTNKVFIEVANWKSALIRKTSTRLGLRTDSSQRFEKTLDSTLTYRTLLRTVQLIKEICPESNIVGKPVYDGISLEKIEQINLDLDIEYARKVLGSDISDKEMEEIFSRLDFKVKQEKNIFHIEVPSYRATKDVSCDADLIEELGRFIGYDNIKPVSPKLDISPVRKSTAHLFQDSIRNFLTTNACAHEVMTSPLVGKGIYKNADMNSDSLLKLLNAISKDAEYMRSSLIPSMLEISKINGKNFDDFKLFELGRVYLPKESAFSSEREQVVFVNYSKNKSVFIDSINQIDMLFSNLNLTANMSEKGGKFKSNVIDEQWSGIHPFEFVNYQIMGKMQASVFSIHPYLLKSLKIKGHLTISLFDYQDIFSKPIKDKTKYKAISKTPVSNFDYTVTIDTNISVNEILKVLKKVKVKELTGNLIKDQFVDQNGKHITIRSTLGGQNQNLSSELISNAEKLIVSTLEKNGFFLKTQ